jgi:O-antigen ligase
MRERVKQASGPGIGMSVGLWLALMGVPLAVAPRLFVAHDVTPKLVVLAAAACVCLAAASEWYPGLTLLARDRLGRVYLGAIALQWISLTASSLGSADPALSLEGTTWRRFGLATQLIVLLPGLACAGYFTRYPERLRRSLLPLLTAGGLTALFGIGQYLGYDFLFDPRLYTLEYFHLVRPPATLGHAMYFAAFLLPVIFLAGALLLEPAGKRRRAALLGCILLAAGAIVVSGTRSALVGLLTGGVVFGARNRTRVGRRGLLLAAGVVAALSAVTVAFSFTEAGAGLRREFIRWTDDSRGGPRLMVWQECLGLIGQHPLLGSGPETFAEEFRAAESPRLARAYPDFFQESPHNLTLEIAVAQGCPGWLAFALLAGASLCGGWKVAGPLEPLATGLLASITALLTALQFMPLTITNADCLFIFAGILAGLGGASSKAPPVRLRAAPRVLAGAICVIAAVAVLLAIQDWFFARAGEAIRKGDLRAAAAEYEAARRLPFPRTGPDLWLSQQFAALAVANPAGAGTALRLAAEASQRSEIYGEEPFNAGYQSAALAIAAGNLRAGEEKLRSVVQMAPNWYKPHLLLAESLLMGGREQEGKAEAALALDLAGSRRDEMERSIRNLEEALARQGAAREARP